ncbi:hypothetical protein OC844_006203 [Tilletia horrida]|nr:hypothetical protein OC844_006203 [Tilletia horrida]
MDEDDIMRSASDDEEDDDDDEEGDDIEWVGVETKRKEGESVHAWLLRKFDTTERAKRVDAGKKRKRGDGGDGNESEGWQDDDDDGADADGEADMHGNGHHHALRRSNSFVPAHGKIDPASQRGPCSTRSACKSRVHQLA